MPDKNTSFVPGDVVQLKSGGPLMTVESLEGEAARCEWFADHSVKIYTFSFHMLKKANPA